MRLKIYDLVGTHYTVLKISVWDMNTPKEELGLAANRAKLACGIINQHCQPITVSFQDDSFSVSAEAGEEVLEILRVLAGMGPKLTLQRYLELSHLSDDLRAFKEALAPYIAEDRLLGKKEQTIA